MKWGKLFMHSHFDGWGVWVFGFGYSQPERTFEAHFGPWTFMAEWDPFPA